jgi:3,4-dihydroxyphenylacetate 2,3-dioxygenase
LFVASGSCSHALVRGPERWPAKKLQKLDHQFVDLLTEGRGRELRSFLPEYVKTVEAEMGGRHLAILLGVTGGVFRGKLHAYGPSSGSGNPIVSLFPR